MTCDALATISRRGLKNREVLVSRDMSCDVDKADWSRYQWNAYVEAGESKDERRKRLDETPDEHKDAVKRHVQTVFAIRNYYERKK
jgi:hypothetical protein